MSLHTHGFEFSITLPNNNEISLVFESVVCALGVVFSWARKIQAMHVFVTFMKIYLGLTIMKEILILAFQKCLELYISFGTKEIRSHY